jgi:hypothetical protein
MKQWTTQTNEGRPRLGYLATLSCYSRVIERHTVSNIPALRFTIRVNTSLIWHTLYAKSFIQLSLDGSKVASELVTDTRQ